MSSSVARCHAIASPSRSGSEASSVPALADEAPLSVFMRSALPRTCMYSGSKLFSMSIAMRPFGRSRTWPMLASTRYFGPSIFSSVLAFAGDSTMTSVFPSYCANFWSFADVFDAAFLAGAFFAALSFVVFSAARLVALFFAVVSFLAAVSFFAAALFVVFFAGAFFAALVFVSPVAAASSAAFFLTAIAATPLFYKLPFTPYRPAEGI